MFRLEFREKCCVGLSTADSHAAYHFKVRNISALQLTRFPVGSSNDAIGPSRAASVATQRGGPRRPTGTRKFTAASRARSRQTEQSMSPQSNRAALPLSGQENAGWPDGSTGDSERPEGGSASGAMVVPLARSLAILTAFSPHEPWLGNQEIVIETGIPAPTVSRMARSLVTLGYLHYSPQRRSIGWRRPCCRSAMPRSRIRTYSCWLDSRCRRSRTRTKLT